MSINIRDLISNRLREWVSTQTVGPEGFTVASEFWVDPIEKGDPEYKTLVANGIAKATSMRTISKLLHETLLYVLIEDDDGRKLFISDLSGTLPELSVSDESLEFVEGELHFLQLCHLITKYEIPAFKKIPYSLVADLPVFEDDLIPFFPKSYTLHLKDSVAHDDVWIVYLKASLLLERKHSFILDFEGHIVEIALAVPSEGHGWIFEQLLTAVQSGRLISFYLELYKLFEFFFPLDNIFKLADRLDFADTELELLEHCRGALSWSVNHQKGARSALVYATVSFAEICLDERCSEPSAEMSFKERAAEKMTNARHALTHQDFRSVAISTEELRRLTLSLMIFLQEAFKDYSKRRKERLHRKAKHSVKAAS